jgi:hypothetical protein
MVGEGYLYWKKTFIELLMLVRVSPMTHILSVIPGIFGSSVFGTAALTYPTVNE